MRSQREFFLRSWLLALVVALAGGTLALRPDSALRTLWHTREIALDGDDLSTHALREGGHLRAIAPETSASDEDVHAYAERRQSLRDDIARNHARARRRLAIFTTLLLAVPPAIAGMVLAARQLAASPALARLRPS
ncbi:MAG TPA: hypothetical protein VGU20_23580 [Stellaceae bacterium]|nr:hypothetical protein [Stellaceae bacterium]